MFIFIRAMELAACFALIIILIRLKIPVGLTLSLTALFLSLLEFSFSAKFFEPFSYTLTAERTWVMIATILLVVTLGDLLAKIGYLERMVAALKGYIKPGTVARVAPALIGLLPMPGGAMVSAPIVEELSRGSNASAAAKTASNFWWRHIWEPVWPLYQSVILAAAILGISVWQVAAICYPITLVSIVVGVALIKLPLVENDIQRGSFFSFIKDLLATFWPVLFILFCGLLLDLSLVLSLAILFVVMFGLKIVTPRMAWQSFKEAFSFDVILIFLGGLSMMRLIETGQGAAHTMAAFQAWGIPADFIVFFLPFIVGLLTGLTAAYVGVGFPIVSAIFMSTGGLASGVLLAYTGGLMGIMISPVHLCLVLTRRYFNASLKDIFKILIPVIIFCSVLVFLIKYIFYGH